MRPNNRLMIFLHADELRQRSYLFLILILRAPSSGLGTQPEPDEPGTMTDRATAISQAIQSYRGEGRSRAAFARRRLFQELKKYGETFAHCSSQCSRKLDYLRVYCNPQITDRALPR